MMEKLTQDLYDGAMKVYEEVSLLGERAIIATCHIAVRVALCWY